MEMDNMILAINNGDFDEDIKILYEVIKLRYEGIIMSSFVKDTLSYDKAVDLTFNS